MQNIHYAVVLAVVIPLLTFAQQYDEDGDVMECDPTLADDCFKDVMLNLQCQMSKRKSPDCLKRNVTDLCSAMDDALSCTSDIIDTSCGKKQGRDRFDAWLRGLRAIYYNLCDKTMTGLIALTQNPHCWSPITFLACTERSAGIDHMNDLLRIKLDLNTCNRLLVSTAVCNVEATTTTDRRCTPSQDVISEMLHTFFSATDCGKSCFYSSNASTVFTTFSFVKFVALTMALLLLLQ